MIAAPASPTFVPGSHGRAILKSAQIVLLLAMTIRHAEFYLFPQGMLDEMGWRQPWIGVSLIPVTTAFGFFMFWGRGFDWKISNYDKFRFVLIGSIPLMIALYLGQLTEALQYSYLAPSRRPSFLILLPICLSILAVAWPAWLRVLVLLACGLVAMFWQNFISYYVSIFLLFGFIQGQPWFRRMIDSWLAVAVYGAALVCIFEFRIERVNMLLEFLLAAAFLGCVFSIVRLFAPIAVRAARWQLVAGCGTLYFYLAQGLLFTGFKALKVTEPAAAIASVVFMLALFLGWGAKQWDKRIEAWVNRRLLVSAA